MKTLLNDVAAHTISYEVQKTLLSHPIKSYDLSRVSGNSNLYKENLELIANKLNDIYYPGFIFREVQGKYRLCSYDKNVTADYYHSEGVAFIPPQLPLTNRVQPHI